MNQTVNQNALEVQEQFKKITEFASNPLGEMRVLDSVPVGKHIRQGDVYVKRIESFNKEGYKLTQNRQLAPGSTMGSRHTVSDAVNVYEKPDQSAAKPKNEFGFSVAGPVIEADTRFTISHPEHASFSLPAGCYEVSYQVDTKT